MDESLKRCSGKDHDGPNPLPPSEFYRDERKRDRLSACCKTCVKRRVRNWRLANAEASRDYKAEHPEKILDSQRKQSRDNAVSRDTATHHGEVWTGPQLEIVAREGLTPRQQAVMLGRTIEAVRAARHRMRYDPKFAALAGLASRDNEG